jgi:DNA-binding FrmR family transcriptional regulator
MRLLTAARGAINGAMAEVVEDHIQMHMVEQGRKPSHSESVAASELVDVLKSYIR